MTDNHVFIGGAGSEVGRAFFWRPSDQPDMRITTARLILRFGLHPAPELAAALDRWLEELSPDDAFHILDLAYHENRICPWHATQFCCDPTHVRHAPLLTMRGVELMMSLPPEWKRSSRLGAAMIEKAWPELARYPYNTLGPLRDGFIKLQRALNNPRLVLTKLRRLRG